MIGQNYLEEFTREGNAIEAPEFDTVLDMAKELLIARKIVADLKKPTTAEVRRQLMVDYDILTSR